MFHDLSIMYMQFRRVAFVRICRIISPRSTECDATDECASTPCQHNSTCSDSSTNASVAIASFYCACLPGWQGSRCHVDVDECASDPCEHGARCVESSMGLIISGYIEGSSHVRLIELFNPTCDSIDLGGYGVSMITNGGSLDSASTLALSGSLAGGGSFVICHSGQDVALYAGCDMRSAVLEFNGDDALALMREGQVVDVIGEAGIDPGRGWAVAGVVDGTRDHTLLRAPSVLSGNADWSSSQASEWVAVSYTHLTLPTKA